MTQFVKTYWLYISLAISPIPACGLTAWLVKDIPVVRRGNSDYGYLSRHWEFAWIALALFSVCTLATWCSSPRLRYLVAWDRYNAKRFLSQIQEKTLRIKALPTPSEQELSVWSGQYKLKPIAEKIYESGQRRNKRSA